MQWAILPLGSERLPECLTSTRHRHVLCCAGGGPTRLETKIILSSHDFEGTPDDAALRATVAAMWASGADVAKVATTAKDITDARRMLALLEERSGVHPASAIVEQSGLVIRRLNTVVQRRLQLLAIKGVRFCCFTSLDIRTLAFAHTSGLQEVLRPHS